MDGTRDYHTVSPERERRGWQRRWQRSNTGRSPASLQIHQKLIKVWNNSYKATFRWQQRTPGLQGDKLSSLKWGRREEGDIKRAKTENFWAGACAPKEGGSPENRSSRAQGNSLTGGLKGEPQSLGKPGKAETWRAVNRKLYFSVC